MSVVNGFANILKQELEKLDSDVEIDITAVEDKTAEFTQRMEDLQGADVVLTESVAEGILDQSGLRDVTPDGYADSVAREAEPSAADVAAAQALIRDGKADILLSNEQSHTSAANTLIEAAKDKGVPVVNINETPNSDQDYFDYVDGVLTDLEKSHK